MRVTDEYKKEKVLEISGAAPSKCMKCGKCSASCPNFDEMDIKPHQFVSYVIDSRIDELMESKTIYKCLSCMACIERCPRSVKPGKLIDGVRQLLIRQKGENHLLSDNVPQMCEGDDEVPQQLLVSAFRRYKR